MDFDTWMRYVDAEVSGLLGLSVYDLPDRPYRDMYEDEYTPEEAAAEALEYAGAGVLL